MNKHEEKKKSTLSKCEVIVTAWFQLQSPCNALGFLPCCWVWRVGMSLDMGVRGDSVLCQENCLCSFSHPWLQSWLISCSVATEFQLGNGPQHHQGLLTLAQPKLSGPKTQVNCAWAAVAALGTSMHPQVHFNILLLVDLWRCRVSCLYLLGPWSDLGMNCIKKLLMPCGISETHFVWNQFFMCPIAYFLCLFSFALESLWEIGGKISIAVSSQTEFPCLSICCLKQQLMQTLFPRKKKLGFFLREDQQKIRERYLLKNLVNLPDEGARGI